MVHVPLQMVVEWEILLTGDVGDGRAIFVDQGCCH
jgi:hypothetical protein